MDGLLRGFGGRAGFGRIWTAASPPEEGIVLMRSEAAAVLPRAGATGLGALGIWDLRRGGGKGGGAPLSREQREWRRGPCMKINMNETHKIEEERDYGEPEAESIVLSTGLSRIPAGKLEPHKVKCIRG